jgi:hypothetical protein
MTFVEEFLSKAQEIAQLMGDNWKAEAGNGAASVTFTDAIGRSFFISRDYKDMHKRAVVWAMLPEINVDGIKSISFRKDKKLSAIAADIQKKFLEGYDVAFEKSKKLQQETKEAEAASERAAEKITAVTGVKKNRSQQFLFPWGSLSLSGKGRNAYLSNVHVSTDTALKIIKLIEEESKA